MTPSDRILAVSNLRVSYDSIRAVDDISFEVGKGEIVTLIGANGAGKSSILRAISGLDSLQRQHHLFWKGFKKYCRRSSCRRGHCSRAGRPGHLRQSDSAGKFKDRHMAA